MIATSRASLSVSLPFGGSEQESLESVLDALAPMFDRSPAVDGERGGALLVVSDDAGAATAVRFWHDALAVGLAVASPGAFPWCLANAPCAAIAQRFGVTGPNLTWLASLSDPMAAFDGPSAWLADWLCGEPHDGRPAEAWLAALHFGAPAARAVVWHWTTLDAEVRRDDPLAIAATLREMIVEDWSAADQPR